MKIILPFLLLCFYCTTTYGQYTNASLDEIISTYSDEKLLIESSRLLEEGYYSSAEKIIDKLLSKNADNCNYNYRKGFVLAEGRSDYSHAIPYLEKAIKDVDKNYDMYSGTETSAAMDSYYRLARCYHRTGNVDKAEQNYKTFLDQANKKTDLTAAAQLGLDQLVLAKKSMEFPKKNVTVLNLGSSINSNFPEYSPVISFDGSALYFTSRRPWTEGQTEDDIDLRYDLYPEDIYVAYKDFDETWVDPIRLDFCEPGHNEASISVSPDERRVYVYLDSVGNGDIYYSDFSTNRFQEIEKVKTDGVNSEFWDTHCTVSPDGRNMYFASDRPGGFGGRDIYRVVKLPDGSWGLPFNLGASINSAFDEDSPFMASDNRTLYFASNGPKSMGGFDIMVSVIDEDNNWSAPINLGYPLNSTADDLFYTETLDGRRGYITSTRGDSKGEKDIYEIQNDYLSTRSGAILKGKIITLNGRKMPEDITVTLACTDCGDEMERTVYPRIRDGVFMMNMEPCHEYEVILHHSNGTTEFYRENIKTDCSKDKEEIYREMFLDADKMAIVTPESTIQKDYYFAGLITDGTTKKALSGTKVTIINKATGEIMLNTLSSNDGTFTGDKFTMKPGELALELRLEKEGYVAITHDLKVILADESRININDYINPIILTENVAGVDLGKIININPIYFDYGKWDIRPDAKVELDKIVKIMKENPKIKIELGSHTDSRASTAFNLQLSDNRAKASAEYIISQGIDSKRIKGKGYGESKLIVSDAKINKMATEADKEEAHQKNRRTEFIIVK